MKLTVIGGGGFRTPLVYWAILDAAEVGVEHVALHDVDETRLVRIGSVLEGMARERGRRIPVSWTTDLKEALDSASFVFCAVRAGGLQSRVIDETVPQSLGVLGQETTGPAGINFALRNLPVMDRIARVTAERAPRAWFLNFTNPAGLITEALRDVLGDRVIGICDSPTALCRRVAAALDRPEGDLEFDYFGLNHLGWLKAVRNGGGEDLLPYLLADDDRLTGFEEGWLFGPEILRKLGMIPNEYLYYHYFPDQTRDALALQGETRGEFLLRQQTAFYERADPSPEAALASWRAATDERNRTYMAEARAAAGITESTDEPPAGFSADELGYGGVAVTVMAALSGGGGGRRVILNVPNRGAIPFLDPDAVVEVPARVTAEGAETLPVPPEIPDAPRVLIERVKEMERVTIRAAREGSAELALRAIAMHPLVPSDATAREILGGYLAAQPDLRSRLR